MKIYIFKDEDQIGIIRAESKKGAIAKFKSYLVSEEYDAESADDIIADSEIVAFSESQVTKGMLYGFGF